MTDLSQQIADNASGPAEVEIDGQKVKQHSVADQIEADRYAKSNAAAKKGLAAIRRTRGTNPGSV